MMAGLPGSGKSRWASEHRCTAKRASFDDGINIFARSNSLSYEEAFKTVEAKSFANKRLSSIFSEKLTTDLVIDMTNLSCKARSRRLSEVSHLGDFDCVELVFLNVDPEICYSRQKHNVPRKVFDSMVKRLQYPQQWEKFDVVTVLNFMNRFEK